MAEVKKPRGKPLTKAQKELAKRKEDLKRQSDKRRADRALQRTFITFNIVIYTYIRVYT